MAFPLCVMPRTGLSAVVNGSVRSVWNFLKRMVLLRLQLILVFAFMVAHLVFFRKNRYACMLALMVQLALQLQVTRGLHTGRGCGILTVYLILTQTYSKVRLWIAVEIQLKYFAISFYAMRDKMRQEHFFVMRCCNG